MEKSWKYWGKLENGGMVFISQEGEAAVEKDYRHLVEPKPEEKQEIYRRWPELMGISAKKKGLFPAIAGKYDAKLADGLKNYKVPRLKFDQDMIKALRGNIKDLVVREVEREKVIDTLKYGNEEKEKMILTLMEDIKGLKAWVDNLRAATKSWIDAAAKKDSQIAALRYELTSGEYSKKE